MLIKQKRREQWICQLTEELDKHLIGKLDIWHTYIYIINEEDKHGCLALRVPGQTIGEIILDENDCILSIRIGDWSFAKFDCDVNDLFKSYIGMGVSYE